MNTLLQLLEHVQKHPLLANSTYCPREIGARLRVDPVELEMAMIEAEKRDLVALENRWTGGWRRIVLTPAGKEFLEEK